MSTHIGWTYGSVMLGLRMLFITKLYIYNVTEFPVLYLTLHAANAITYSDGQRHHSTVTSLHTVIQPVHTKFSCRMYVHV